MKILCESLREHTTKKVNSKKKKTKLLTKEQQGSYENVQICYIFICIYINLNLDCDKKVKHVELNIIFRLFP